MRRTLVILFATIVSACLLPGCGAYTGDMDAYYTEEASCDTAEASYMRETAAEAMAADTEDMNYKESDSAVEQPDVSQIEKKLIRTVSLNLETENFSDSYQAIRSDVEAMGGYVESVTESGQEEWSNRTIDMTVRIPSDKLDAFLSDVEQSTSITYHSENVEDVTLNYVDLDTHKKTLETERDRLLGLMERAENVSDLIELEERLGQVRYEIESLERQLRTIDNDVAYSTVYLTLEEVKHAQPTQPLTGWERISKEFSENTESAVEMLGDFFIGFLVRIPYFILLFIILLFFGGIILVFVLLGIMVNKKNQKRIQKKLQRKMEDEAAEEVTEK